MIHPLQQLSLFLTGEMRARYPNVPAEFVPPVRIANSTPAEIVHTIFNWLRCEQHPVEMLDKSSSSGVADIGVMLNGRRYVIQVFAKNAIQDYYQYKYQQALEYAGGCYISARSFNDFHEQYSFIVAKEKAPKYPGCKCTVSYPL